MLLLLQLLLLFSSLSSSSVLFAPKAAASSTVSGKCPPLVSGNKKDSDPTSMAAPPMVTKGRKANTDSRLAITGAKSAPILARVEQRPIAELRTGVGNNSAE